MLLNVLAMVSHAPLFLLLLKGKLSLHISKRNLVSTSDRIGHRFRSIDASVGLFSLLSPVLVEDAGEDDLLRRDVTGINVEHLCSKAGTAGSAYHHHEIARVLAEELIDLLRPEEM